METYCPFCPPRQVRIPHEQRVPRSLLPYSLRRNSSIMSTDVDRRTLDKRPDASDITSFRNDAKEQGVSVEASYTTPNGNEKRMVVSPRGTVVILNDVSEATFNQSRSADEIATAIRDQM